MMSKKGEITWQYLIVGILSVFVAFCVLFLLFLYVRSGNSDLNAVSEENEEPGNQIFSITASLFGCTEGETKCAMGGRVRICEDNDWIIQDPPCPNGCEEGVCKA